MQESQINLAIQAIASSKKLSVRRAAKIYNIPHTTLTYRIAGRTPKAGSRSIHCKMTELEEKSLFQYIIDMDERGFSPRISDMEDIANYILETRGAKKVGKLWAHRFVKRHTKLKTRFNCIYDFQRTLYKDSEFIERWFRLISNIRAKYSILDCDLYNFDETGFMMGQISPYIVVTKADRYGKSKAIQPGNREWATAIICVDGEGHNIPLFLIVKDEHHLSNWYTESDLPYDWLIKPTTNEWTNNEIGLEWIKHFNKHTESRKVGRYRMLVLDGHESYKSPAFQEYCKEHNIILLSLLPHSSHLIQPLDIGCFDPLKHSYNRQIENFIKAHITYITKTEFFQAFKAAYIEAISISNELLAYANTLLTAKVYSLCKANEAFSKLRRVRKALIRKGGALSVEDGHSISEQENVEDQIRCDEYTNDGSSARRQAIIRRCSKCGSTLHNARTCQFDPALVDL
ncbi:hypothetical protein SS1G_00127 [Sclerotinia sclerotiorum 1980 UF-70]|uniref:HTH CENPB-type domain-containing protein n=1 Tax=Sclerotinia sclerotiorum (strain ATCC 18683 / 1980 / Ss-1) TaxID=665079 RepID=A7E4A5_SCLS1|nr:hypothetical protein SS1G_00127 [Sclerotinia sclerotiorum 1980 UF-70]EDN90727.1 hypothetical protein SS1G_00127 [Sclerotinia sclerotiorum 1980 UF-70]